MSASSASRASAAAPANAVVSPLIRVDADGAAHLEAEDGLFVANGMCLTDDGLDPPRGGDVGRHDRQCSPLVMTVGSRTAGSGHTSPTGCCPTACVSMPRVRCGSRVRHRQAVRPRLEGGVVVDSIAVPEEGRHAIACALGGHDRRTLYMLTATTFGKAWEAVESMDAR